MQSVLVCFALREEATPFKKIAAGRSAPTQAPTILITGIGHQNANEMVREAFAANLPSLVLTCGFAGGLNPKLKSGDVVFGLVESAVSLQQLATRLFAAGAKEAKFFCSRHFVVTAAEKQKLYDQSGADAVEMESEVIHTLCRKHGIPSATIRVILDTATEDLPLDFNQLTRPDLRIHHSKLAMAVMKSPGKIVSLFRLFGRSKLAAQRLAEVLAKVIWPG